MTSSERKTQFNRVMIALFRLFGLVLIFFGLGYFTETLLTKTFNVIVQNSGQIEITKFWMGWSLMAMGLLIFNIRFGEEKIAP